MRDLLLLGVVLPSQKVLCFIDAPTSKVKIVNSCIEDLAELAGKLSSKKVRGLIPSAKRHDLGVAVDNKIKICLPNYESFWIQLNSGDTQSLKKRPETLHYFCHKDHVNQVPVAIPALASRAKRGEGTLLRCMCKNCPLRSPEELQRLMNAPPDAQSTTGDEIDEDLKECVEDAEAGEK